MAFKAVVFDAYGTLFDIAAAARRAAAEPGQDALAARWPELAEIWRQKQLQYTWLRASAGAHCDFWALTQDGLDYALEATGLAAPHLRARLLDLYWELDAYPEVVEVLGKLKSQGLATAILSNGTPQMLDAAVASAQIGPLLDDVLSVEAVGIFKPAPQVYELVTTRFNCVPRDVLFVSANGWDAGFAAHFGFHTAWVNRAGAPMDRLPAQPAETITDLTPITRIASQ